MNITAHSAGILRILAGAALIVAAAPFDYGQAAAQTSEPQTTAEPPVKLPAFNVTESPGDPYNAAEATSAARTAGNILDSPMTIDVVTPAVIADISPDTLFGVSNYFAGVSAGRATGAGGINDRQTFRGFESFSRSVDNFSDALVPWGSATDDNFDPVFLDHVELIMGPDSILSPTGTPGGTINAFTKSPLFTRQTDLSVKLGNYNADEFTVDTTGPIGDGKHMAYRVIAEYQDAKEYLPGAVITYAGAAEFTYKFSDTAKLTFKYFGTQQRYGGTACEDDLNGEEVYTPDTVGGAVISNTPQPGFQYAGWNGDATWSYRVMRDNKLEDELTAALGDHVNMRLASVVYYATSNTQFAFPQGVINETWDPVTGVENSVSPVNPASVPELSYIEHWTSRQIQAQNDFAGNFEFGGVTLQPTVGWAYQNGAMLTFYALPTTIGLPNANLAVGYYDPPIPPNSDYNSVALDEPMEGWTVQTYAYLRAGFLHDRIFVSGGASRTWAGVNFYNDPYLDIPSEGIVAGTPGPVVDSTFASTGNPLSPSVQPWHDTYMGGILFKVLPNVSAYYNYSTNAQLASFSPLWQAGVQHEFGVKTSFFNNRISISADHFQITESNVTFTNPAFDEGTSTIPVLYADLTSHGYEVNVVGGITKELSVIASYTDQTPRDAQGRRRANIPDTMSNLLLDYHFDDGVMKNSDFWFGLNHQGDVAGETVSGFTDLGVPELPGFYLQGFTVFKAGAGYKFGRTQYNLSIDNLFNQKFWWQASSARSSVIPYPGFTFSLTMTVHI
jgi:iron complex outermembrane receptor protein